MKENKELFPKIKEHLEGIALKGSDGSALTYGEACELAEKWRDTYFSNRHLVLVLCDYAFETVRFILEMFLLGQPMLLLQADISQEFLKGIMEKYAPYYIWRKVDMGGEGKMCLQDGMYAMLRIGVWGGGKTTDYKMHPDLAVLISTSGSTGSPKMVKLSYKNLIEGCTIGCRHFHIESAQRGILSLPMNHVAGLIYCMYHWFSGATAMVTEHPLLSRQFADFYDEEKINNIIGVPFSYRALRKVKFWEKTARTGNLNAAICGGAKLDETEQEWLVSVLGSKFYMVYGQTECMGIVMAAFCDRPGVKTGTAGKPIEGINAFLDEKGELIIESPCVCMGYAMDYRDLAKGDENQGIVATGDLAREDEDGYFYLIGRIRRIVKIMGKRFNLDEVEEFLKNVVGSCEFACTGEQDELNVYYEEAGWTEMKDAGNNDNGRRFRKILSEKLHIPPEMIHCKRIEQIPRSGAGKILYYQLC